MSRCLVLVFALVPACGGTSDGTSDALSRSSDGGVSVADVVSSPPDAGPPISDASPASDRGDSTSSDGHQDTVVASDERTLGSVSEIGECEVGAGAAAAGYTCQTLEVSCPDLAPLSVDLIISQPAGEQRGVAVLGSGTGGTTFYSTTVMQELTDLGFRVVNRKWHGDWTAGTVGMVGSACRYATLVTWIRAQDWSTGPVCASGNSGGSAEVAYVLSHWERGDVIDLAVLSGGPPMSRFDLVCPSDGAWVTACEDVVPEAICGGVVNCAYNAGNYALVDGAFEGTPCSDGEPLELLREHSILSEDARVSFPDTALHLVQGDEDCTSASPQGYLYSDAIESEVTVEVAMAPHGVFSTPDGVAHLVSAFDEGCVCRHAACGPTASEGP